MAVVKEVFWRPAAGLIAAASTLSTFWSFLRYTVLADLHFSSKTLNWVLSWHWNTWAVIWLAVWIIVIFDGTVRAIHQREDELKRNVETLQEEIIQLEDQIKNEAKARESKFSFWLQVDKDKKVTPTMMKHSQRGAGSSVHVDIPAVSLVVLNEGQKTLKVLGFVLELEKESGARFEHSDYQAGIPPAQHVFIDAKTALMNVLSGPPPWDFYQIQGAHTILGRLHHQDENGPKYTDSVRAYINISLSESSIFTFEVSMRNVEDRNRGVD